MCDDGQLAVGLLDLQLGSSRRDVQGVIIGSVGDHDGARKMGDMPCRVKLALNGAERK